MQRGGPLRQRDWRSCTCATWWAGARRAGGDEMLYRFEFPERPGRADELPHAHGLGLEHLALPLPQPRRRRGPRARGPAGARSASAAPSAASCASWATTTPTRRAIPPTGSSCDELPSRPLGGAAGRPPAGGRGAAAPSLAVAPRTPRRCSCWAWRCARQGRLDEGCACARPGARPAPDHAAALINRAQARIALGPARARRAPTSSARCGCKPDLDARVELRSAGALTALGDAAGAERAYRARDRAARCRSRRRTTTSACCSRTRAHRRGDRVLPQGDRARPALRRRAQQPRQRAAPGRARATRRSAHYEEALRIDPQLADAHANYGTALQELGRVRATRCAASSAPRRCKPASARRSRTTSASPISRATASPKPRPRTAARWRRSPTFHEALNNLGNALAEPGATTRRWPTTTR